ncbi:MAG: ParB N-terminal domain-containing protein [Calditrichia bacterium]
MKISRISIRYSFSGKMYYRLGKAAPELITSVSRAGILQPLFVLEGEPVCIMDGMRRLQAAAENPEIKEAPVVFFPAEERFSAFVQALHLNISSGLLSAVEKLRAVHTAHHQFGTAEVRQVAEILELQHFPHLDDLRKQVSEWPLWLQEYGHRIRLSLRVLEKLRQYPFSKYKQWLVLADRFNFKGAELLRMLEQLRDIQLREGPAPAEVWLNSGIDELLKSPLTAQQQVRQIKSMLEKFRLPILNRIEHLLQQQARVIQHHADSGIQLQWDKTLETPGILLQVQLPDTDAVNKFVQDMQVPELRIQLKKFIEQMNHLPEEK